jgi:hypothetical protein
MALRVELGLFCRLRERRSKGISNRKCSEIADLYGSYVSGAPLGWVQKGIEDVGENRPEKRRRVLRPQPY